MNRINNNLIHLAANEALIRAFEQQRVRFVVIGGLAMAWYCPQRQADDMDLLVQPLPENSARVVAALNSVGIFGLAPDAFARNDLQVPLKQHFYAELLTPKTGESTFEDVHSTAVDAKLFGVPVRVASRNTLLRMKAVAVAAGGPSIAKHQKDIGLLHQVDA